MDLLPEGLPESKDGESHHRNQSLQIQGGSFAGTSSANPPGQASTTLSPEAAQVPGMCKQSRSPRPEKKTAGLLKFLHVTFLSYDGIQWIGSVP